jgi:hypothetical protein
MKKRKVMITIVVLIAGLIGWDIYLATDDKKENTISNLIQDASHEHPMIPFALGVLIGHWLWDNE